MSMTSEYLTLTTASLAATYMTGNVTMMMTSPTNTSDASTYPETAVPPWWKLNFFSFFVEHPAMRDRASIYLTFRLVTLTFLLPAGLLGNTLTVAVMLRPRMRKQTFSLTLSLLAVSDGCCLIFRVLVWVNIVFVRRGDAMPIRFDSEALCG